MSAPTLGIFGEGEEIGAALSRERERPRYYDYSPASNKLKFVHTSVALGATFRLPLRVRSIFLNARERLNPVHSPKVGYIYYKNFTCSREVMRAS